jgi:hypothetical protein
LIHPCRRLKMRCRRSDSLQLSRPSFAALVRWLDEFSTPPSCVSRPWRCLNRRCSTLLNAARRNHAPTRDECATCHVSDKKEVSRVIARKKFVFLYWYPTRQGRSRERRAVLTTAPKRPRTSLHIFVCHPFIRFCQVCTCLWSCRSSSALALRWQYYLPFTVTPRPISIADYWMQCERRLEFGGRPADCRHRWMGQLCVMARLSRHPPCFIVHPKDSIAYPLPFRSDRSFLKEGPRAKTRERRPARRSTIDNCNQTEHSACIVDCRTPLRGPFGGISNTEQLLAAGHSFTHGLRGGPP